MAGEGKLCARYPCKNRGNVAKHRTISHLVPRLLPLFLSLLTLEMRPSSQYSRFLRAGEYETDRIEVLPPSSSQ